MYYASNLKEMEKLLLINSTFVCIDSYLRADKICVHQRFHDWIWILR